MNLKSWIVTARLRTLPLSLSAVAGGILLGIKNQTIQPFEGYNCVLSFLILLTAVLLQILSNFANDYGDAISGLDNANRIGPLRSLSQGNITRQQLKYAIILVTCLSMIIGGLAVVLAFYNDILILGGFILLGGLAVIAAITYTIGLVYGYHGLGDVAVFVFFGLIAVIGSEFMMAHSISLFGIFFGALAGFMSVLVLNVNNLRDYENDKISGKNSIVVMLGVKGGKIYHAVLLTLSLLCLGVCLYCLYVNSLSLFIWIAFILALPLIKSSLFCVDKRHINADLDCMLKRTSLSSALINFGLGCLVFAM